MARKGISSSKGVSPSAMGNATLPGDPWHVNLRRSLQSFRVGYARAFEREGVDIVPTPYADAAREAADRLMSMCRPPVGAVATAGAR